MVTCSNPACGKAFSKPLKTLNLRQDSTQTFAACPFCLTKIIEPQAEDSNKPEKKQTETILSKEKTNKNQEKPSACQQHLGYLSEREKNQKSLTNASFAKILLNACLEK